jgi:hypothetical protein
MLAHAMLARMSLPLRAAGISIIAPDDAPPSMMLFATANEHASGEAV